MTGSSPGRYATGLVALALSVLATACTASTGTRGEPAGGPRARPPAPGLVLAPAADATSVPVTDPVTVYGVSAVVDTVTIPQGF